MTSHQFPPSLPPRILIDTSFLRQRLSALANTTVKGRTWNESGENLLREFMKCSPMARFIGNESEEPSPPAAAYWCMAKNMVHEVVALRDPKHDAIRQRLGNLQNPSTPVLLSTLGLWLAGVLGISVSVTSPLVAVMLYGVAEADGDWEVLGDPKES